MSGSVPSFQKDMFVRSATGPIILFGIVRRRAPQSALQKRTLAELAGATSITSRIALKQLQGRNGRKRLDLMSVGSAYRTQKSRKKHLIVSIGAECYLTITKGQLIPTGSSPSADSSPVPGGGHLLIVPISHYPTLLSVPPDLAISIISEVEQYKSALRSMFAKHGAVAVMFEVARLSGRGGHAHIQVVPVPMDKAGRVEDAFRARAEMEGIRWESDPEAALEGAKRGGGNYFRVDLPDGRKMISFIRGSFNLQFGRATLAEVLGLDERADWKACPEDDAQQRADAAKFKKAFASFDPANES
ncbi:hypothetical protein FRC12_008616 [Ceratobasidium sp. 428]|nr:hypothetical protein FRC12_008616 [Ceratobasidium sp. 428]